MTRHFSSKARIALLAVAAVIGTGAAGTACAHHSFAMFDSSKTLTLTGTVYKFEWSNPHVWLWVSVPGPDGNARIWGLESGAPTQLKREGLSWNSFKAGDSLTVTLRPMKDGATGGRLISATFADGHQFHSKDPNLQEPADAPANGVPAN